MEDPYEVGTSSDEETERQRQDVIRKKQKEKAEVKSGAYGAFVPEGNDVGGANLTVEELEHYEDIVAGNYKPLTAAPSADLEILLRKSKAEGGEAEAKTKEAEEQKEKAEDSMYSSTNAYGGIDDADNYGSAYGAPEEATKRSYGAYSVPRSVIEQRVELGRLSKQERESRIRYEKWSLSRVKGDISLFERTQRTAEAKNEVKMKSWNQAFLEAQDLPENTPDQVLKKYRLLSKLSTDFIEIAKVYGRTVISEYFLGKEYQTVETIKIGGVAGGTKYIVRGILFKLAVDPAVGSDPKRKHFVYGGKTRNYEYAAKAAGHELKGAINMHKYYNKGICVPMQALVDFHGYRLVAMPLLPLKGGKLIYGSKDTGKTIRHDDPRFNEFMKEIAADLHLAGHGVCDQTGRQHFIYAAGDIEGHIGTDGRYYLIDLARSFPPESLWDTHHLHKPSQAVFFRMLRPEFLQWLKKNHRPNKPEESFPPLSCDALTNWGQSADDSKEHNDRVREATNVLINKVVPEFAATFVQRPPHQLREIRVSEELHRHGINVRHMGLVRFMIRDTDESSLAAQQALLISMVGRTLKNLLRREMRVEHDAHKNAQPSDHDSRAMVVDFLNLVTRAHPQDDTTEEFWSETVPFGLMKRFGQMALSQNEQENLFSAIKEDVARIVKYVVSTTGVQVHATAMRTLEATGAGFEFVSVDLGALTVRIKHMSVIDYATAKVLSQEAYQGGVGIAGDRLLSLARRQFNRTLQSDPLNDVCASEANITRLRIVSRKYENRASQPQIEPQRKARYFKLSDEKLFAACAVAARSAEETGGLVDSDDLANMIRAVLTTWQGRKRGPQADLFPSCGGASHVSCVKRLIKFVESTRNRLLTLELCAFLATCRDPSLAAVLEHFVKELTAKEKKDIETQGIPPMEVKQTKAKASKSGNAQSSQIQDELVIRLSDKLTKGERSPTARTLVVVSNLLAATESPALWVEAVNICHRLMKTYGKDAFYRWYRGSPWNLIRSEANGLLSDYESKCISSVIRSLSPLRILDLRGLKMKDEHVEEIAEACASLPEGTSFAELRSTHTLPVVRLRANDLDAIQFKQMVKHDVAWLFALLRCNKSVQKVLLAHTDLDSAECRAICKGIANHSIRHFELRGCDIDDDELLVLGEALRQLGRLEVLRLPNNMFTDKGGVILGQFKTMTECDLSGCKGITDQTIGVIARECKRLRAMNLARCSRVTDEGARSIAAIANLEELTLTECMALTDKAMEHISAGCPRLRTLKASSCTNLGSGALMAIAKGCKSIETLDLSYLHNMRDAAVVYLSEQCASSLRTLVLGHCPGLTDKSIAQVGQSCRQLQHLDISVCSKITDESINEIAKGCHELKELNLAVCEKVTDAAICAVAQHCADLEALNVSCCDKITDEAIVALTKCAGLQRLNIYSCKQVTDTGIKELSTKCKRLRHLDLFWCEGIKEEAIETIMKNNPECKIHR